MSDFLTRAPDQDDPTKSYIVNAALGLSPQIPVNPGLGETPYKAVDFTPLGITPNDRMFNQLKHNIYGAFDLTGANLGIASSADMTGAVPAANGVRNAAFDNSLSAWNAYAGSVYNPFVTPGGDGAGGTV
ncbi:MAG: hypothetical protein LBS90_08450 [Oscillospiraceae bacterium]|jgi:hypothetical protein|nr:hypothetical protein [Oscillospiraceae bacterium]